MPIRSNAAVAAAIAMTLGFGLSGCGDTPNNRTLYSVNQPVVAHDNYTLDLGASPAGLTVPEQQRLADWFDTMTCATAIASRSTAMPSARRRARRRGDRRRHGLSARRRAPGHRGLCRAGQGPRGGHPLAGHVPAAPTGRPLRSNLENATTTATAARSTATSRRWSPIPSTCCTAPKAPARPW
jgi:pilus assembly protein CpaD